MKTLFYSTKDFEKPFLEASSDTDIESVYTVDALSSSTCSLAKGFDAVSIFTGDDAGTAVIDLLKDYGVKMIATRAAGYDNIDIETAKQAGIKVANVPAYSPNAIAEHTVAMMLALDRKLILADTQVRKHNFALSNLVGFDLKNKTVGIIGTGRIGRTVAMIMNGFGCNILAHDQIVDNELVEKYNVNYTDMETLCMSSDVITLHVPLTKATRYLIDERHIGSMKRGVMLINTSRGPLVNTSHVISALKAGQIGYYGMDVYENEKGIFFYDHQKHPVDDIMLKELMGFPNVLITPHQAFATNEALTNIADATFLNLRAWKDGIALENEI